MSIPDQTTVLIVGAGPSGLAAALSLLHHGLSVDDFVIVDAVTKGDSTSRALIVHAATLEALDTIGCGDDIVAQGYKAAKFVIDSRSHDLISPAIGSLKQYTRHSYALMVPQSLTERALENKLTSSGVTICRPLKVIELKRNAADSQFSDVTFDNGKVISAKYVIGADGAHSVVRHSAGMGFADPLGEFAEGENNVTKMVLADVILDGVRPDTHPPGGTMSSGGFFLTIPMPTTFNDYLVSIGRPTISEPIYRIGSGVPLEEGEIPHSPSKEYLQNLVDRFGPYKLSSDPSVNPSGKSATIKEVIWSTRFRNRAAIADKLFARLGSDSSSPLEGGVILLVGDAAHIHSPAGGQGMNLGLRDAIFLGEAVTKHIHASDTKSLAEADKILFEFAQSRHARALEVIKLTKGLLSLNGMKYRGRIYWWLPVSSATMRDWILWVAGKIPFAQRKMAWELSGLGRR